ncbi:MAG: hypothetical protein JXP73_03405 [Deltaproteobacteria bacterium]|nr:hypothetical protein [Deltaproteobacteria bacterium]
MPGQLGQLVRLGLGLPGFLREPVTAAGAAEQLRRLLAAREARFLDVARRLIYGHPGSPYRALLRWAGCAYADLEAGVRRDGIETTLRRLRAAGVYVRLAEFKGRAAIARPGLALQVRAADFDNPQVGGRGVEGTTSGGRGAPTRIAYDWELMREHAATEFVLNHVHGVERSPLVLWLPTPPSIAGIHYLLLSTKARRPPVRWFSQVGTAIDPLLSRTRLGLEFVLAGCRLLGHRVPRPEPTGPQDAARVADFLAAAKAAHGACLLRTYASSAVRAARAAVERGHDLRGCVMLTGGEPLTGRRRAAIEKSGATACSRYSATETGLIAGACGEPRSADDMHLYMERLALVSAPLASRPGGPALDVFLFTTLCPHMGKILFNTDIGDFGVVEERACGCDFGKLGMTVHLREVRSYDKLSTEGMSLLAVELHEVIAALVEAAGGGPDDYQFWESEDEAGLPRLVIAVSPRVPGLDETSFRGAMLAGIGRVLKGGDLAARIWRDAGSLEVVRADPVLLREKHLPLVRDPRR